MRRLTVVFVTVFVLAIPAVAQAANPHFRRNGTPRCTDTGSELVCTGSLTGLGNQDLVLSLSADAFAEFFCGAPGNRRLAPGQNKVPFAASGDQTVPGSEIKNGNATFRVSAPEEAPPTPTPEEAGCANPNWHVVPGANDIDFSNIRLTITQGVLLFTCTYGPEVGEGQTVTLDCVAA